MPDSMVTGAASSRQRSLAAFFAATFLGLALFFLIVGVSRQHSAMLAASGSLAICGLALLLVVLRMRKMEARAGDVADTEEDESGEDFVDELNEETESDTGDGDEAPAESDSLTDSRKPGRLPEPRPRNEERLFEHKTDDLRDSVNYR